MSRYRVISHINSTVNTYPYKDDISLYGCDDFWTRLSNAASGDCEDYALEKRAQLLESGVPAQDIRLALCWVETGEYHAILLVKDDDGNDWALDNRHHHPMTHRDLKELGYRGDRLQVHGQPMWEEWEI